MLAQDYLSGIDPVYWQFWIGFFLVVIVLFAQGGILGGLEAGKGQTIVGFAAEHGPEVDRARQKLTRKGLDLIVLNDISNPEIGFDSPENAATLISSTEEAHLSQAPKDVIAEQILEHVETLRASAAEAR